MQTPTSIIMGHFPVLKNGFAVPALAHTSLAHYVLYCSQIIFQEERHSLNKFTIPAPTQQIFEFLIGSNALPGRVEGASFPNPDIQNSLTQEVVGE